MKITKSKHPLKNDLPLCLFDLLDEGDDTDHDSKRWVESINHGGLTRVNNSTYDVFVSMESEIRNHLSGFQQPNLQEVTAIMKNEDFSSSGRSLAVTGNRAVQRPCFI